MPRYIDAEALSNFANNQVGGITANHIMRFPTADVEPVRHGKWEIKLGFLGEKYSECSYCRYDISNNDVPKHILKYDYKYCPNCGAKMDKEVEE